MYSNSLIITVFLNFQSRGASNHDIQPSAAKIQFLRFTKRNSTDQADTIWRGSHQLIASLNSRNPSHSRFARQERYIRQNFYLCSRSTLNFLKERRVIDFRLEELDASHPYYSGQKEMPALSKNRD